MTDLATRPAGGPISLAPPAMSPWLRDALRERMNPHPDAPPAPLKQGVPEEAARAAAALEARLRPATPDEWAAWLMPFRAVLANPPPDRAALARAAAGFAGALPEVPAAALTAEAQREVMRTMRFWPTPADVWPILHPRFADRQAELLALRRLAAAPVEREAEPMSPEQRAAMAERARALAGELRASAAASDAAARRSPARAYPLSEGALLARYEQLAAEGNAAAATRAEALRAKLGGGT